MKKSPLPFIETVRNQQAVELARRIGRGLDIPADEFAELTNVTVRNLHSYKAGENLMPLNKFLEACRVLGPSFTNSFLALIGQEGADLIDAPDGDPHVVICDAAQCIGEISQAMQDGRIDHVERVKVIKCIDELDRQLHRFRALLEKQA